MVQKRKLVITAHFQVFGPFLLLFLVVFLVGGSSLKKKKEKVWTFFFARFNTKRNTEMLFPEDCFKGILF